MKTVEILLRLMQVGLYAGGLGGGARGLEGVLRPGGLICLVDRVGGGALTTHPNNLVFTKYNWFPCIIHFI